MTEMSEVLFSLIGVFMILIMVAVAFWVFVRALHGWCALKLYRRENNV
jgi:uncharacterized membrane protein